jgi:protein-S-isoprenylcysteine O-methyltransferase Ste14
VPGFYTSMVVLQFVLAALTVVGLRSVVAPYGRHGRGGWGPTVPARVGWVVMEAPASLAFLAFYLMGDHRGELVPLVLLGLWQIHYVQRAFVYPFLTRGDTRMPLAVAGMAICFNLLNAYINGRWISGLGTYDADWLTDPRFVGGVALFVGGYALNRSADRTLRGLRGPGETGYKVPQGGAYRWVSCPNYLGEIVEWVGWAIATWSTAGLAYAVFAMANLGPRALAHHRWYRETFADYPADRHALVPYVL